MYARALAVVADGLWRHAQDGANVCVAEARFQQVAAGVLAQAVEGVEQLVLVIDMAEVMHQATNALLNPILAGEGAA